MATHAQAQLTARSLNKVTASATTSCLTGCAIGEVAGFLIGTALGWSNWPTVALAVALAYATGYSFTMRSLLRSGIPLRRALGVALAADTASITTMEITDNAVMLVIPGAMTATLGDPFFWGALAFSLAVAWVAAFPINRWLIARGRGCAHCQ
jgi:hypothetical protein